MAEAIDKLVSSSTFTPNQVLILLGEDPSDDLTWINTLLRKTIPLLIVRTL